MGLRSRNKGKRGEREAAGELQRLFNVDARRGRQFQGSDESPDVVADIPGLHFEVKRCEDFRLYPSLAQASDDAGENIPVEAAAGETRPLEMARRLADAHRCNVVVTYGGHGMVAAEQEGGTWYLPAEATEVRDVCGAGDTVLAAIGTVMVEGICLRRACRLATKTGGRQVAELGITAAGPTLERGSKGMVHVRSDLRR